MTETTRPSATQTVLRDAVDHCSLLSANLLLLSGERRLRRRLELLEGLLVTADERSVDRIVCDIDRKRLDVRNVDEGRVLTLEVARQETLPLEALPRGCRRT